MGTFPPVCCHQTESKTKKKVSCCGLSYSLDKSHCLHHVCLWPADQVSCCQDPLAKHWSEADKSSTVLVNEASTIAIANQCMVLNLQSTCMRHGASYQICFPSGVCLAAIYCPWTLAGQAGRRNDTHQCQNIGGKLKLNILYSTSSNWTHLSDSNKLQRHNTPFRTLPPHYCYILGLADILYRKVAGRLQIATKSQLK